MTLKNLPALMFSLNLLWLPAIALQAAEAPTAADTNGGVHENVPPDVRKSVLAAVEQWKQAVIKKDRRALESIFDSDLSYGHTTGEVVNKAGTIERALDPAQSFSAIDITDVAVRAYGDFALVTHKIAFHVVKGDVTTVASLSGVDVWVKKPHGWQLLARQLTRLPQQPAS
jgi:ketosteroid isomerase-like protein